MSTISDVLEGVAPWLNAGLTGGPAGIGILAATKIAGALGIGSTTPDALKNLLSQTQATAADELALTKVENDFEVSMRTLGYKHQEQLRQLDIDQMAIVNKTMIAEIENSEKETWYQKGWRPFCGFSVGAGSFLGVILCGVLCFRAIIEHDANALAALPGLASSIALILGVPGAAVGISAWHRGRQQVEEAKGDANVKVEEARKA
jgi:roadblock/LC7 domain-containing protein